MRFASVLHEGVSVVVAYRDGVPHLVPGVRELGLETDCDWLASAGHRLGPEVAAEELELRPVVPAPRRIVCLGLNYRSHVDETKRELPEYPVLFAKWASTLAAAGEEIALPPESSAVDYEAELAIVIGRAGRRISREDALDHVGGLTIANDVTMRDYQYKTHQWLQGKVWDRSTPLGPQLVTLDEAGDPQDLELTLTLNGEQMQSSSTARMIFDVSTIIATISELTTLDPGDVILSGTPGGVGYRREPKVLLGPGDETVVEIAGIGRLVNRFVR